MGRGARPQPRPPSRGRVDGRPVHMSLVINTTVVRGSVRLPTYVGQTGGSFGDCCATVFSGDQIEAHTSRTRLAPTVNSRPRPGRPTPHNTTCPIISPITISIFHLPPATIHPLPTIHCAYPCPTHSSASKPKRKENQDFLLSFISLSSSFYP